MKANPRTAIRYALFRCKAGTPDLDHLQVLESYSEQLEEHELDISSFTVKWDVSKEDTTQLVFGKTAKEYNKDIPLVIPS